MTRARGISAIVATLSACWITSIAPGQEPPDLFLEHLDEFVWTGAGDGTTWQNPANWSAPAGHAGEFPNDPGRIDTDQVTINPIEGANLSVPLTGDLSVSLVGGNVTVASLKMGGTGAAVTTNITSASSLLVFENQELNDTLTNPGDPEAEPPVQPEPIWSFNQGRALIWSTGTQGAGEENRISANIKPNDEVDVEGDRDLHIHGSILEGDRLTASGATFRPSSLSSLLASGAWLHLHGNIELMEFDEDTMVDGTQDRPFFLNSAHGIRLPDDPQNPPNDDDEVSRQGNIDFHGRLVGDGVIQIGSPDGNTVPIGSVILRADSRDNPSDPNDAFFAGRVTVNRGNLVLAHDGALGSGDMTTGNPNQGFGFNFVSTDDARNIANDIGIAQWQTVAGATSVPGLESFGDHSIEFSGEMIQNNTRGWINLLGYDFESDSGKTLTLSGPQYPLEGGDNTDTDRIYTIDGTGKTLVTGGIHNRPADAVNAGNGHFRKRGTGTVVVDYDETNTTDSATDYAGYTWVEGGNLHFATNTDLPNPGTVDGQAAEVLSLSGAVGVDEGVLGNTTFLGMLNNSSNPNWTPATTPPFFRRFPLGQAPIFSRYDNGGLMLAEDEYDDNLDFSSGDLARAANMSLAAWEEDSTYTGTITPSSTVIINPSTYQLGGGSGSLTLPNSNQLTGTRNLLVTNGGEVRLQNSNNYTGTTTVIGKFESTLRGQAAASLPGVPDDETDQFLEGQLYRGTTLTVTSLSAGASSIGNSSSDASNLVIQGSTLKYVGGAVTTSRLFTVGTAGATIDASGSGALVFNNTGSLGIDIAEDRAGVIAGAVPSNDDDEVFGIPSFTSPTLGPVTFRTDDLVPGMAIRDVNPSGAPALEDDLVITSVPAAHVVRIGEAEVEEGETPWAGLPSNTFIRNFTFGPAPERQLTLTGSSTASNTLAPVISDASDGGVVGLTKTGTGTWIVTGDNTYTGDTTIEAGTLSITNDYLANAADVLISTGATFNLNFVGSDAINGLFFDGAPQAVGLWGALGNASADFNSALLTGSGLLQVTMVPDTGLAGDYNNNGVVDAADYTVWQDNLGGPGTALANRDPDNMDPIGQADYAVWKANFGMTAGGGALAGNAAVPEPAGAVLAAISLLALGLLRSRHRRASMG